jgi:periplasmic divalent cation tolerance protein
MIGTKNGFEPPTEMEDIPKNDYAVVFCSAGSEENAALIGRTLVEERLAACTSIVPGVRSIYAWKGALCDEREWLLLIKTRRSLFPDVRARVAGLHSYEIPEIVCVAVDDGNAPYLRWLLDATDPANSRGNPE